MNINFILNGKKIELQIEPEEKLLSVLRRLGMHGVKQGCEDGSCGVCTVLLDNKPVLSCLIFAAQINDREITTVEGLGDPLNPHPIQQAFVESGAVQCGYCIPAMIVTTKSLLDDKSAPTTEDIKEAFDGIYCRCTGYVKQIDAVKLAAKKIKTK